jgi:capsular polysaccharide biosynthesis protein
VPFLSLFRGRTWWAVLAATAAAGIIGAALSIVLPASYRAEATLLVTGPTASRELQLTYVDLLKSDAFLADVARESGATLAELREGLKAIPAPGTTLIGVVVEDTERDAAIEEANVVAERFDGYLVANGLGAPGTVAIVREAESASRSPSFITNSATGAVAGFLAAVAAAVFLAGRPGHAPGEEGLEQTVGGDDYEYGDSPPSL